MGTVLHFNVTKGNSLCKHIVIRNVFKTFTYFYWCLVYRYYSWYFGSARVSLSGWWYMLHSEVYHRYYTIPFLHGAPCVSAVCLWWQRQQCTSRRRTRVTLEVQTASAHELHAHCKPGLPRRCKQYPKDTDNLRLYLYWQRNQNQTAEQRLKMEVGFWDNQAKIILHTSWPSFKQRLAVPTKTGGSLLKNSKTGKVVFR